MTTATRKEVAVLAAALDSLGVSEARCALVLGSGLGDFAERLENATSTPFAGIEGLPASRVEGHAGRLVVGDLDGVRVVVQQGRVHLYEGWSAEDVTRSVRAFGALGVPALVLTNAAGGLRPDWPGGTLVRISDHVDMQGRGPLTASEACLGNPYDAVLGDAIDRAAQAAGVPLERGVYVGLLGPSYETPAEVRMLRELGGDAVGMSTVAEAQAAHAGGMRVAGISLVSNPGAGLSAGPLSHDEVIAAGVQAAGRFALLLERAVPMIAAELD